MELRSAWVAARLRRRPTSRDDTATGIVAAEAEKLAKEGSVYAVKDGCYGRR